MKIFSNKNTCKILVVLALILMVTVNAMANILPINGVGTGEVSDSFPDLFAPSGLTFAIWGVIYVLLAVFAIYQTGLFSKDKTLFDTKWLRNVGFYFVLSSMANTIWIFAWHYKIIELSLIMMLVILASLIKIIHILKKQKLSTKERLIIKLPFSVYFGWITVATIANIVTLLVAWNWNRFGLSEQVIAILVIGVGAIIGISTVLSNKDIAFGMVFIWAYMGILLKHLSESAFNGEYKGIITTVIVSIVLFVISIISISLKKLKKPNNL